MIYGIAPKYLQNILPCSIANRNQYNVRNAAGLSQSIVKTRLTLFDHSFLPSSTRLWNMLPETVRTIADKNSFKKALQLKQTSTNKHSINRAINVVRGNSLHPLADGNNLIWLK